MKETDKEFWKKVDESLKRKDGEYISINPNGEEITHELLEKMLWS